MRSCDDVTILKASVEEVVNREFVINFFFGPLCFFRFYASEIFYTGEFY